MKQQRRQWLSLKRLVHQLSLYEWPLVGSLALASFLAGWLGYWQLLQPLPEYSFWDPPYLAVQFFLIEATDPSAGWPWYMQLARFVAPTTLIYTAVKAVLNQLGLHLGLFFLRCRPRGFVIVVGLGETGFRLAQDFANNSDDLVIAIEQEVLNPYAAELRHQGVTVVYGSALDPLTLLKVHLQKAKQVFVFTGSDETNIAIGKLVERLVRPTQAPAPASLLTGQSASPALECFIAVEHPDLYEVFEQHPFFNTSTPWLNVQVFNQAKTVARNVLRLCAPDLYYRPHSERDNPMHILLLGFEALTRELIIEYAASAHYLDCRKPRATLVCPRDSADLLPKFLRRFPMLPKALELNIIIDDPLTLSDNRWREIQQPCPFTLAYLAMKKDVEAVLSGRRLHRFSLLDNRPINFVVCLNQQTLLADVLDDDFQPISPHKSLLDPLARIEYFETLDETLSIDMVVHQSLDDTARCIHNEYRDQLYQRGETDIDNASLRPWSQLPPHKKLANQRAASHIDVKLRLAGFCRGAGRNTRYAFPPSANLLETLAEVEHRRWMADKYLSGYDFGPVRDEARRLHPDLVEWDQLSESDKEKDRDNIRRISRLLSMQHQHACPIGLLEKPEQTAPLPAVPSGG